ncbi:MAG: DoxX family protein [Cyclobacteriaceae bacterium]|nr:DoxX family protein [Cyclobacteriaceae bacterium]
MTTKKNKTLNISLWVAQTMLAALFLMTGTMKSTQPVPELAKAMPWVNDFSVEVVRFIGVSEFLGGLGLLLPSLFRIKPSLTPLAALGLLTIMVLALGYHINKGEYQVLGFNVILGSLALFVAWGRYKKSPIQPR